MKFTILSLEQFTSLGHSRGSADNEQEQRASYILRAEVTGYLRDYPDLFHLVPQRSWDPKSCHKFDYLGAKFWLNETSSLNIVTDLFQI